MKAMGLLALVVAAFLMGCGSSDPTEQDAAQLLEQQASVSRVRCAKVHDREFVCQANAEGDPVVLHATVAEDAESVVVTKCDDRGSFYRVCDEVG
jgi:hypothetical protein